MPGAWELFQAGREADYFAMIAEAADAAAGEGARVALAQASMAGAAPLARVAPLTSPIAGLRAMVAAIERRGTLPAA